jgi:hypothetical protein
VPELEPVAIDEVELVPALVGGPSPDGRSSALRPASAVDGDGQGEDGSGVYRIPRDYR